MRSFPWIFVVCVCGLFVSLGCSDDGVSPAETISFGLRVIVFEPDMPDAPVEGAEVCEADTDNCETTDSDGMVAIELPIDSEVELTIAADGYVPALSPNVTGSVDITGIQTALLTEDTTELLAQILDTPYPFDDTGVIAISALTEPLDGVDNGIAGVTFALASDDPYYLSELGIPTFALDATTVPDGAGGFIELSAGVYEVGVGGTGADCEVSSAWPGPTDDTIRLPVRAGYITQAILACDP